VAHTDRTLAPYRPAPGFFAALGGALVGFIAGGIFLAIFLWPFALASSTALVVGSGDGFRGLGGLLAAALLLVAAQIVVTAWVTQYASSFFGDAPVRFGRALGGIVLGYATNLVVGPAIGAAVGLPILGGHWIGLVVVALFVSSARPAPVASPTRR
jgi:hypothetical protein